MTSECPPVVSTEWLAEQLKSSDSHLITLDATWDMVKGPKHQYGVYLEKHIPDAQYFDLNEAVIPRPTCARNLPDRTLFTKYAQNLGINNDTHIVVYDFNLIQYSTKTWWIFKAFGHDSISVLDGGLQKWIRDGYETESGTVEKKEPGNFEVKLNKSVITEYAEMAQIVKNQAAQIIDCRRLENFLGQEKEPCTGIIQGLASMSQPVPTKIETGRMYGARYIYKTWVLDDNTGCFLPKEKLMKLFSDHGVDLNKPLVTTCYMGHTATLINMAAELCGAPSTLYYGSWTEFGQLTDRDMVSGPESPYDGPINRDLQEEQKLVF